MRLVVDSMPCLERLKVWPEAGEILGKLLEKKSWVLRACEKLFLKWYIFSYRKDLL